MEHSIQINSNRSLSGRAGHHYGWPHCFGSDIALFLEENGIETDRVYPCVIPRWWRRTSWGFMKIKRAMMENPARKFTLAGLVEEAHMSVPHFCSLWNRNLSVGEVAEMSGCGEIPCFYRHFKKHYGESPGRLRRRATKIPVKGEK